MKVGICLITKNCYGPYLTDWLQYHTDLGVDIFYIYDHESNPPISHKIGLQTGDFNVHLLSIQGTAPQLNAYNHCAQSIKTGQLPAVDRLAFIDDDEFIFCENNDIKTTLQKYENVSGLGINWLIYGSSGLKTRTPVSQRRKFVHHIDPKNDINKHIKTIANPFKISGFTSPHCCNYTDGTCVDVDFIPISYAFTDQPKHHTIWLKHYWTRSEEEFKEKASRTRADSANINDTHKLDFFYDVDSKCTLQTIQK